MNTSHAQKLMVLWFAVAGLVLAVAIFAVFSDLTFLNYALVPAIIIAVALAGRVLFVSKYNPDKVLLVVGTCILVSCGIVVWRLPDPNAIPIYPHSEDVRYGEFELVDSGIAEAKINSFRTKDPIEKVLDYYEVQLIKEWWVYSYRFDNTLEVYHPGGRYRIRIQAGSSAEQIQIRVWHSSFP